MIKTMNVGDSNSILPALFCNVLQVLPNEDGSNVLPVLLPAATDWRLVVFCFPRSFWGPCPKRHFFVEMLTGLRQINALMNVHGKGGFRSIGLGYLEYKQTCNIL